MTHDAWQISLQMPSDGGENKMKSQQIDISSICCHGQQLAISFPFWSLSNAHTCAMPLANKQPTALENLMKHSVHMTWIQMKKIPSNCQTFKQTQNTLTPNYHNFIQFPSIMTSSLNFMSFIHTMWYGAPVRTYCATLPLHDLLSCRPLIFHLIARDKAIHRLELAGTNGTVELVAWSNQTRIGTMHNQKCCFWRWFKIKTTDRSQIRVLWSEEYDMKCGLVTSLHMKYTWILGCFIVQLESML